MMRTILVILTVMAWTTVAVADVRGLSHVTVPVGDYSEALTWYTNVLALEVREDTTDPSMGADYRWITVGVRGQDGVALVLNRSDESPRGRATFSLESSDCRADYATLASRGVRFSTPITEAPWGCFAEFVDLYGNGFLLVQSYSR